MSAKYGVPVSIILAQAAQESGWGKKVVGNAYFGVKGRAPDGASVSFATHEDTAQGHIGIQDNFRAYKDFSDAADDYGATLKKSFPSVFANKNNPAQFAEALQRAHYATDPKYAAKLKSIIKNNHLEQYDLN